MASIKKVETLLAKVRAGVRIKDSEWPAWMRGAKSPASWSFADDRSGTVTAYLAAILAAGGTAAEAAVIANIAAGIEVGKLGAATVSADEVLAAYDDLHG